MTSTSPQRVKVLEPAHSIALPAEAILGRYQVDGTYADCFVAKVNGNFGHAEFVIAFYTTWLFKIERVILKSVASRPSSNEEAAELAEGTSDRFAAWQVEERAANQLLLRDFTGRTRSWLMTATDADESPVATLLYFGSAVVPRVDPVTGIAAMGATYRLLLGFHKLYSRMLLRAACVNLQST